MYDKNTCRTLLNNLKKYVKLGKFADDYGLARTNLSLFMKSEHYDHTISADKLNDFIAYISRNLENLT